MSLLIPVLLAGGEGRRLLPGAPPALTKPFLKLAHPQLSLLQQTVERALRFASAEEILTVTSDAYVSECLLHLRMMDASLTRHRAYEPAIRKPTICSGGKSVEEYVYEFPSAMKVVGFPKDFEVHSDAVDYRATYRMKGNTLTVTRELDDKTATNVCSATYMADYQKSARSILRDLRAQVLISE